MSAIVHKAVEPDNLSVAGKRRYVRLLADLFSPAGPEYAAVQPKYDGVYVQFAFNDHDGWKALSRTGEHLKSVGDDILDVFYTKAIMDRRYNGELWLPHTQHSVINGLSRKRSPQRLDLILFDSFDPEMDDETYKERMEYLIEGGNVSAVRNLPMHEKVFSEQDLYDMARELTGRSSAYDGLMLKDLSGYYKEGRGKDGESIKIKPRKSGDFRVVGTTAGIGNRQGGIGALVVDLGSGITSEVGTGLSLVDVHDRGAGFFVGKIVEVEYLSLTKDGKLREPAFKRVREDKTEADTLDFTQNLED